MIGRTPIKTRSASAAAINQPMDDENADGNDRHCKKCSNPDNTLMVQCDKCDDWYHFDCVGVDHEIVHHDWFCRTCCASKGAIKKTSSNVLNSDLQASRNTSASPTIRVTSVPLNILPQVPGNLPALPNPTTNASINNSILTHVPVNMMFPPLSPNHALRTLIPLSTVTSLPRTTNINTLMPPNTFISPNLFEPQRTKTLQNQLESTIPSVGVFSGTTSRSQCMTVSSTLNQPISSIVNVPLASSTINPTIAQLPRQILNKQHTLISVQARDNAKQGLGDTASQHSAVSKTSTKQRQLQLELQMLDEERKLQEQEDAKKREYIHKRYSLLMELASETSSVIDVEEEEANQRTGNWINGEMNINHVPEPQREANLEVLPPIVPQLQRTTSRVLPDVQQQQPQQPSPQQFYSRPTYGVHHQPSQSGRLNPPTQSNILPGFRRMGINEDYSSVPLEEDNNNLTRSQVVARQAVSRELPTFSGAPEDWPLFLSSFTTTTNMCGYTSEENLVRLQKSLTSKAHEAVKCMLMHPSNVHRIISTLKMRFGNPEVIVHNLMAKISSTPAPKVDKLDTIIEFALAVQNLCATIEACELDEYTYNVVLMRELVDKLPPSIKFDWARYRRNLSCANLSTFSAWLYELAETVCPLAALPSEIKANRTMKNNLTFLNAHSENGDETTLSKPDRSCVVCQGSCPSVGKCPRFAEFSYNSKWATVKEFGICRKCLKKHNGACRSQQVCGKNGCEFKHHQLLHNSQRDATASTEPSTRAKPDHTTRNITESECHSHHNPSNKVLFRVLPVILHGPEKQVKTYAFLDDGSSLSFMDAALATELNMKGKKEPLCLKWTANTSRMENESINISLRISGTEAHHNVYNLQGVHTVSSLGLFHQTVNMRELGERYQHLRGVPADSYQNVQPRLLIGVNNANLGYPLKGREGQMFEPIATKTRLGWVVHGGSEGDDIFFCYHSINACACNENSDDSLGRAVREYFSLEGLGISKPENPLLSREDERAQQIFASIVQTNSGQYETPLLWKYDDFRLPNSKPVALKRYHCLETRMRKEPELAAVVRAQIDDYRKKGYIRKLTEKDKEEMKTQRVWHIPMFPVFNPNKPGKTRIVWDWAAKTNGVSLNSMLLKGPDQLVPLNDVLYKFRENKVGISGDIKEMFLQILIAKQDQYCQLILWKENQTDDSPSTFVTQVMTFGACCSPSCAQYIKNLNANKYAVQHPRAAEAIIKRHYVDDMLDSVETEEEAIQLAKDVRFIHAQAGFEIRNWLSNSRNVLRALCQGGTELKSLNVGSELATEKVLGMWWCTNSDTFVYKMSPKHDADLLAGKRIPTKREVLRTLMSIFDPLGLLSNLLVFLKILFQEIWRSAINWDDEIPDVLQYKWEQWLRILPKAQDVSIPRCYRSLTSIGPNTLIQLHTFVDASELGYAAVVYLRFQQGSTVECSIVGAKSRVAPLKFVSIPRLELQSAVIGVRLANTISKALSFEINEHFYWTDARNVLCWLRSDHRRYSPYVGWRVSEILGVTDVENWKWVGSKDNVADEATKWSRTPDLSITSRWFNGPAFLWQARETWPAEPFSTGETKEELRASLLYHSVIIEPLFNAERFSTWKRLLRTVATVIRFTTNLRCRIRSSKLKTGPLSANELLQASILLYKQAQNASYSDEICLLAHTGSKRKPLPKYSPIFNLNPFLDNDNVLRMHGRIGACEFACMDAQNPVILPKDQYITKLIIQDYHLRYHHRNHETVLNEIRQMFRISKLRGLFKKIKTDCQMCRNQRAIPNPPPMADLPQARLAAYTRPFSHIGIDYFGPLNVVVGRRHEKRWGVLITCLTVRAVHIEIAHSLSADSCIMALRNFMARRGVPIQIFSDRGTNFTAASKELAKAHEELDQDLVIREIVSQHTKWKFLPPLSPHMGGAWERLVQTVKKNLQQMRPGRSPTDEVLRNCLTEIENLINSRPLTHVPVDDPEAPVLTPNHFILGSSSGLKPMTCLSESNVVLRRAWRSSQVEANIFWQRWVRDYLPELTRRTKWFSEVKAIEENDIVLIADPALPRNCWPKGRVIGVNRGKDNQVRSATIQTTTGIYERPATKIAVLDVRREEHVSLSSGVPGGDCHDPSVGTTH